MWAYEHSTVVDASIGAIWRLYTDSKSWPQWDEGIEDIRLDGPFVAGTTGTLTAKGQAPLPFTLHDVVENESFTDQAQVGTLTIRFIHRLTPVPGGTRITHRVELDGVDVEDMGLRIGPKIVADIPASIANLGKLALAS